MAHGGARRAVLWGTCVALGLVTACSSGSGSEPDDASEPSAALASVEPVTVQGAQLATRCAGAEDAPPVLLVSGFGTALEASWDEVQAEIGEIRNEPKASTASANAAATARWFTITGCRHTGAQRSSSRRMPTWLKVALSILGLILLIGGLSELFGEEDTSTTRPPASESRAGTAGDAVDLDEYLHYDHDDDHNDDFSAASSTTPSAPPPPPEPEAFASDCNPNYDPCVPNADDVDCAGGSGNGPAYTGPCASSVWTSMTSMPTTTASDASSPPASVKQRSQPAPLP